MSDTLGGEAARLDERITEDKGYALKDECLERIEAIAESDKPEYLRITEVLKKHRVYQAVMGELKKRRETRHRLSVVPEGGSQDFHSSWGEDTPLPKGTVVPRPWVLTREGLAVPLGGELKVVASDPVVIARSVRVVDSDNCFVELAWRTAARWQTKVVPRGDAVDAKRLIRLADFGVPVTTFNAARLAQFLSDFEHANQGRLKRSWASHQMGWLSLPGDPFRLGFLAGERHIAMTNTPEVEFIGADAGEQALAKAVTSRGSLEVWKKTVEPLRSYPLLEVAIYLGLSSCVIEPLSLENPILDYVGLTSTGKTTALTVAASCWGDPRVGKKFYSTWNVTDVGLERRAAVLNGVLVPLDDKRQAIRDNKGRPLVAGQIYLLSDGCGRSRGNKIGIDAVRGWHLSVCSTGEHKTTDFERGAEGAAARVLTVVSLPLEGHTKELGKLAHNITTKLGGHFGESGPAFARFVLRNRGRWGDWRALVLARQAELHERLGELRPGVASRQARMLATLDVVGQLAHEAAVVPWARYESPIPRLLRDVAQGGAEDDEPKTAVLRLLSHCQANRSEFEDTRDPRSTSKESLGTWDYDNSLWLHTSVVDRLLQNWGYPARTCLRAWRDDLRVLLVERASSFRYRKTDPAAPGTKRPSMFRFAWGVLDKLAANTTTPEGTWAWDDERSSAVGPNGLGDSCW